MNLDALHKKDFYWINYMVCLFYLLKGIGEGEEVLTVYFIFAELSL